MDIKYTSKWNKWRENGWEIDGLVSFFDQNKTKTKAQQWGFHGPLGATKHSCSFAWLSPLPF